MIGLLIGVQVITGFLLSTNFKGFESLIYINNELSYGWIIRTMHANGAYFIFFLMYLHIIKAFIYSSYAKKIPFNIGIILQIMMTAIAFLGYSLPNGQMSY